jgi:hypothetical protein
MTSEASPRFSDGSGITSLFMVEPDPRGAPVRADDATSFPARPSITVPTLVTISVQPTDSSTVPVVEAKARFSSPPWCWANWSRA